MIPPAQAGRDPTAAVPESETRTVRSAVQAFRRGEGEAFNRLVELYQGRLFGLVLMMVRDPFEAEEVTQDAFVRAFTRLHLYDENRPFYPWLATIAVRLSQTWLRQRARVSARETTPLRPEIVDRNIGGNPLSELIADEGGRQLWRMVAALPSGERTAVFMYYQQEMKIIEIARALGVTPGTVKTLLFRARRRLRKRMGGIDGLGAYRAQDGEKQT